MKRKTLGCFFVAAFLLMFVWLTTQLPLNVQALLGDTIREGYMPQKARNYSANGENLSWLAYEYDTNGNCIKTTEYNNDGETLGGWDSEYDSRGNLLKEISFYAKETMNYWYKIEYQYDSQDNCVNSTTYNSDETKFYWTEFEYDSQGKLIKDTGYYGYNGEIDSWNEYEYDNNGNCVKSVQHKEFSPIYGWRDTITGFEDDFEYDANGNLVKHTFYDNGTATMWQTYEYDESGNRTKVLNYELGELTHSIEYEYNFATEPKKVSTSIDDGEPFKSYPLDYYISKSSSTEYNPELAELAMAFSVSAYEKDLILKSLKSHGFTILGNPNYGRIFNSSDPAFVLAEKETRKETGKEEKLVAIIIRGTRSVGDLFTDTAIGEGRDHAGFSEASEYILTELITTYYSNIKADKGLTFFITGHSYGGAVANLLARKMGDQFKITKNRIFTYTFATPNVTRNGITARNPSGKYDNIFNICNTQDATTTAPAPIKYTHTWGKYGRSYWFSLDTTAFDLMDAVPGLDNDHDKFLYLYFMSQLRVPEIIGNMGGYFVGNESISEPIMDKLIFNNTGILCPVDVDVFSSTGTLIAQFIDNQPIYLNGGENEIILYAIGDEKYIVSRSTEKYTLSLKGTDSGTMEFFTQNNNVLTDEIVDFKSFENVALSQDKRMMSEIGSDNGMLYAHLFVVDERGEIIGEIASDGTETSSITEAPDSIFNNTLIIVGFCMVAVVIFIIRRQVRKNDKDTTG